MLKTYPKLKMVWVHAGVSRRCSEPDHYEMIDQMCSDYDNLMVDISWVVWEDVICDEKGVIKQGGSTASRSTTPSSSSAQTTSPSSSRSRTPRSTCSPATSQSTGPFSTRSRRKPVKMSPTGTLSACTLTTGPCLFAMEAISGTRRSTLCMTRSALTLTSASSCRRIASLASPANTERLCFAASWRIVLAVLPPAYWRFEPQMVPRRERPLWGTRDVVVALRSSADTTQSMGYNHLSFQCPLVSFGHHTILVQCPTDTVEPCLGLVCERVPPVSRAMSSMCPPVQYTGRSMHLREPVCTARTRAAW